MHYKEIMLKFDVLVSKVTVFSEIIRIFAIVIVKNRVA